MTVDGFNAKIEYDKELDLFRGEILGLNGGQPAGARSFAAAYDVIENVSSSVPLCKLPC
jgi:predicted HicB family RNase H-like nuclease